MIRKNRTIRSLALAALLVAFALPTAPAFAKGGCDAAFPVTTELVVVGASPVLGSPAYPVVRFVADLGDDSAQWVAGSIAEWPKTSLEFTLDPTDGLWKTEPITNPTPTETLHGSFTARVGGGWIGYFLDSCGTYEPLVAA